MAKRADKAVEPKKTGAKGKYTPERVERILEALRLGATYELACNYGGISRETFFQWLKTHDDFPDRVKEAEGMAAVGWLDKIEKASADGNWQAAAWKLERRYPRQYGRMVHELTGKDDGPVQVEITDARAKLAELIARRNEAQE